MEFEDRSDTGLPAPPSGGVGASVLPVEPPTELGSVDPDEAEGLSSVEVVFEASEIPDTVLEVVSGVVVFDTAVIPVAAAATPVLAAAEGAA